MQRCVYSVLYRIERLNILLNSSVSLSDNLYYKIQVVTDPTSKLEVNSHINNRGCLLRVLAKAEASVAA
jgi:hypothetical protein